MAKDDENVVMMAVLTEQLGVDLLLQALPEAMHLRPLWERLVIADVDGYIAVGMPIANKVTKDTTENHRRHFFSLLNLLEVPLAASPKHLHQMEITRDQIRHVDWPDPKKKKKDEKKAEAEAKAKAEAEAKAQAEAQAQPEVDAESKAGS